MILSKDILHELFVVPGHLDGEVFNSLVSESEEKGVSLQKLLFAKKIVSDSHFGKTIANFFDVPFVDLSNTSPGQDELDVMPEAVARAQHAIVYEQSEGEFKIATSKPKNYPFFNALEKKTGLKAKVYYANETDIDSALKAYQRDLAKVIDELVKRYRSTAVESEKHGAPEKYAVEIVRLLLHNGLSRRASDIHIEPLGATASIRYRIDGILHEVVEVPKDLYQKVVLRIKILSRMRTDETAAPQDGKMIHVDEGAFVDVRVSIIPVTGGENVVMRLLVNRIENLFLESLGFADDDLEKVQKAIMKPHGMILVVGPTGSGKTTTLYAVLQKLNSPEVNVMTIEDPVEYNIEHVQQIQVNLEKDLNFATGLRSIVRQDPDIVMVGEIRDNESASMAINAAMTGHLLLSTLHTNDAATTFPRFFDLGIKPFLVASSVNLIISQRLVRRSCMDCRESYVIDEDDLFILDSEPELRKAMMSISGASDIRALRLYKSHGCSQCGMLGYKERVGIFEVMEIIPELKPLIVERAAASTISTVAQKYGMTSIMYDGARKALTGETTLREIIRVTRS